MSDKHLDFLIGADPEFIILRRNGTILCSDRYSNGYCESDKFGADGDGITFELRPSPEKCPLKLTTNIRDIIFYKVSKDPNFLDLKWKSGSSYTNRSKNYGLGGHIHFGIKRCVQNLLKINPRSHFERANEIRLLNYEYGLISTILSTHLIPIYLLLENRNVFEKRRQRGYGYFNEFRVQKWGFEYRALGSWLVSPYIALAMLCLSKTLMFEILNNKDFKLSLLGEISTPDKWFNSSAWDCYSNNKEMILQDYFPNVWASIEKMMLYPKYKNEISFIKYLIDNKLSWHSKENLLDAWGIGKKFIKHEEVIESVIS